MAGSHLQGLDGKEVAYLNVGEYSPSSIYGIDVQRFVLLLLLTEYELRVDKLSFSHEIIST